MYACHTDIQFQHANRINKHKSLIIHKPKQYKFHLQISHVCAVKYTGQEQYV